MKSFNEIKVGDYVKCLLNIPPCRYNYGAIHQITSINYNNDGSNQQLNSESSGGGFSGFWQGECEYYPTDDEKLNLYHEAMEILKNVNV